MPLERVDEGVDAGRGLAVALILHVGVFFAMGAIDRPEPESELVEFEIAELPEPEPPKPKVEPEKPPEPEQPPEPEKPPEPEPPKPKLRPKAQPPSRPPPSTPPPITTSPSAAGDAPPFELPESRTISPDLPASGSGSPSGQPGGRPGGTGKGSTGGSNEGIGKGPVWAPKGDLYIKKQPLPVHIAELECPAVQDLRISGTVVLLVQVRRDGSVKQARVTKGIGHGCDEIAKKALRSGKFTPAVDTEGKSADYELRYEYVFELEG